MHKPITVEKIAERKKNRELLEKIFGKPPTWKRPKQVKPTNTREEMNISGEAFQRCIAEYSQGRFKLKKGEITVVWNVRKKRIQKKDKPKPSRRNWPTLIHRPTGVSQPCYVEPGNYSKAEKRKLREKVVKEYTSFLEAKVKKYLKACMARQFGPIPKGEYDEE